MAPVLRLDWCSYEAAKYAVQHWHYSKRMPAGKLVRVGVWENKAFIGAVVFGMGANNNIGKPYGLVNTEVCELVRVALREHVTAVSRIVSIAVKMLKRQSPGIKLLVSYADPQQYHLGVIYQALGWVYVGMSDHWKGSHYIVNGRPMHGRSVRAKWGHEKNIPGRWEYTKALNKYKYLKPLEIKVGAEVEILRQRYPKRLPDGGTS